MTAGLLIYLGVVAALWTAYMIVKQRRAGAKEHFGDGDAYEGNLIPLVGESHGARRHHGLHGGHIGHDGGHPGHGGGHIGHAGSHAGHDTVGGHH